MSLLETTKGQPCAPLLRAGLSLVLSGGASSLAPASGALICTMSVQVVTSNAIGVFATMTTKAILSPSAQAIEALCNTYTADGGAADLLAVALAAAKRATEQRKSHTDALFSGLLAVADSGASSAAVLATAAKVRAAVAQGMTRAAAADAKVRATAGLPALPVKVLDYSTASVYGKVIAELMDARILKAPYWDNAQQAADGKLPIAKTSSGLFSTMSACRRHLDKIAELENAATMKEHSILQNDEFKARKPADIEAENNALKLRVAQMMISSSPTDSVITARAERDAARTELLAVSQDRATLRADYQALVNASAKGKLAVLQAGMDTARAEAIASASALSDLRTLYDAATARYHADMETMTARMNAGAQQ